MKRRYSDAELKTWVSAQKTLYKRGKLSTKSVTKLEAVKHWSWSAGDRKTTKQWLEIAKQLVREDPEGLLPNVKWLERNGYNGLSQAIYTRKDAFKDIPKRKLRMSPLQLVYTAEKLALESPGGFLPNVKWLEKNGYRNISCAMYEHRKLFKHIKQHSLKGKSPLQWVSVAKKLLQKDPEGMLPNCYWLTKNSYHGLVRALCSHPKLFKGMVQRRLKTNGELSNILTLT